MSLFSSTKALLAATLVGFAMACSGGDDPLPAGPATLSITPGNTVRLYGIGSSVQLTATVKDEAGNPVDASVTWTADNPAVATVNSGGLVTATGLGTTRIRASAGAVIQDVTVSVQSAQFNVNATIACSSPDVRSFRVEAQSAHLIVVSGTDNPPNGFTPEDYAAFAATFESLVWPVVTENFGTPADIDGNGKVIAFFTRAVNELTKPGELSFVGGFFFGRDLFPKTGNSQFQACPSSNEAEMFYLLAPDPTGAAGNVRSVDFVKRVTLGVIGHELQHLINSSRRLFVNQGATWPETTYMEEGLSHIAEELLFYEASGLSPRMNLDIPTIQGSPARVDAFNAYMISNASRFSSYLKSPSENAPYQKDDDLPTRGASWSFLRYLADRGTPSTPFSETVCPEPITLPVGGRCRVDGAAASQFAIASGTGAEEFTIVTFAADVPSVKTGTDQHGRDVFADGTISVGASAAGAIAVGGPPNPSVGESTAPMATLGASRGAVGALPLLDNVFHSKLRAIERRDLPHRVAAARAAYARQPHFGAHLYSAEVTVPSMAVATLEPVWKQLVNANDTGIANLRLRFGADITGAARDWAVAHYVDDVGLSVPPQYTHPSWNFRTMLAYKAFTSNNGTYPLRVHSLTGALTLVFTNGGAAYYRLGLAPAATSTVRFTVGGGTPTEKLKLVVVRTK